MPELIQGPELEFKECRIEDDKHKKHIFMVPAYYKENRWLGSGAYGKVASFCDTRDGSIVAIKKFEKVFVNESDAKRIWREIYIHRNSVHSAIIRMIDLYAVSEYDFNEIYVVMRHKETDLHAIIKTRQVLHRTHVQHFTYQILQSLRYLHRRAIIHRDIKPSNVLLDLDSSVSICDFGLARGFEGMLRINNNSIEGSEDEIKAEDGLSEYVVTRWYRPPEILLGKREYTAAVDMWSMGLVILEILLGRALFPGKSTNDMLIRIFTLMGKPKKELFDLEAYSKKRPTNARVLEHLKLVEFSNEDWSIRDSFRKNDFDDDVIDLVDKLIRFDPQERLTSEEAMRHPYVASLSAKFKEDKGDLSEIPWPKERDKMKKPETRRAILEELDYWNRARNGDRPLIRTPGIQENLPSHS